MALRILCALANMSWCSFAHAWIGSGIAAKRPDVSMSSSGISAKPLMSSENFSRSAGAVLAKSVFAAPPATEGMDHACETPDVLARRKSRASTKPSWSSLNRSRTKTLTKNGNCEKRSIISSFVVMRENSLISSGWSFTHSCTDSGNCEKRSDISISSVGIFANSSMYSRKVCGGVGADSSGTTSVLGPAPGPSPQMASVASAAVNRRASAMSAALGRCATGAPRVSLAWVCCAAGRLHVARRLRDGARHVRVTMRAPRVSMCTKGPSFHSCERLSVKLSLFNICVFTDVLMSSSDRVSSDFISAFSPSCKDHCCATACWLLPTMLPAATACRPPLTSTPAMVAAAANAATMILPPLQAPLRRPWAVARLSSGDSAPQGGPCQRGAVASRSASAMCRAIAQT
mmetsp:Transcript_25238/g.72668  ORF Transcript_25238/g.72668 Transcript_25238/m.72668 type:complete len:402 (+) Transcript_25238:357-1562(+)